MIRSCIWVLVASIVVVAGCGGSCPSGTSKSGGRCLPLCTDTDVPDLGFVDANCDGVDGDVHAAVFVSPNGDDTAAGTRAGPVKTISHAVELAQSLGLTQVLIARGTYEENVTVPPGIGLYGGYDPDTWQRYESTVTKIEGADGAEGSTAVVVPDVSAPTELQLLTVEAPDATMQDGAGHGLGTYALRVLAGSDTLTIAGSTLIAGRGADGDGGNAGQTGKPGNAGSTLLRGLGPCGYGGGAGAAPVLSVDAAPGEGPTGGSAGANGSNAVRPTPGQPGGPGGIGAPGEPGDAVPTDALFQVSGGRYQPADGSAGTDGEAGSGGGGGGAGGSSDLPMVAQPYGGGGGAGGCPGTGGTGGRGGGGSFALWVDAGHVALQATTLRTAGGGNGGPGGNGGVGGTGGAGGPGQTGSVKPPAAEGGAGGHGAQGGHGGGGSGGAGGASIGIVLLGTATADVSADVTFDVGAGGSGGAGGGGALGTQAPSGPPGLSESVYPPPTGSPDGGVSDAGPASTDAGP